MKNPAKKALIIKLSSLGDVIFTIPLANTLKENGYEVGWIVSEKGIDVIKDNPCVDKVYLAPLKTWKKRGFSLENFKEFLSILKEIRKEKYDIAIDCQQMFKSLYWMLFCGAKRRIISKGAKELSIFGGNEVIPNIYAGYERHSVLNYLEYAKYLGLNTDKITFSLPESTQEVKSKIDELLKDINTNKPIVVISPATTWDLKHWNKDNWKEVVDAIKDDCSLVFTGTEGDKDLIFYIGGDNYINLAGKTNVEELKEVFERADIVIAPDSGSAHVARAVNKPAVIAIFTCTPPGLFGPFGDDEKYFALNGNLLCQPCFTRVCSLTTEDKNLCTKRPAPQEIITIVKKMCKKSRYSV